MTVADVSAAAKAALPALLTVHAVCAVVFAVITTREKAESAARNRWTALGLIISSMLAWLSR